MGESVGYTIRDGVAVLTIDNPPVNALTLEIFRDLGAAAARAAGDPGARAIVLRGAGRTFIAGADINIFQTLADLAAGRTFARTLHEGLRALEDCPKPLVAALHGTALGGGLELALACHYRVAVPTAKLGQPEVALGIVPGAGGTQRLPRLIGAPRTVEMCTGGAPVTAAQALEMGLVDRLIEGDLEAGAIAFAREQSAPRRTRDLPVTLPLADREATRRAVHKLARGARAPVAALEAIEAGLDLGFDSGCDREIEIFTSCVLSRESSRMVRLFFAEREAARVPDISPRTAASEVRTAAVVGAGTMGGGIAMCFANAGIPVLLQDTDPAALERGLATIRRNYEATVARGKLSAAQYERNFALIRPTLDYSGFAAVDLAIEAVFENLDLKRRVFAELAAATRPETTLASNTSTLDIDAFATASGRPDRTVGLHFFSPANVMKLIEIVRGRQTGPATLATALQLTRRLGKVGVVVGNGFGFVANRMLDYYRREAYLLLEEGATVEQVDAVMTGFGMPVGPFAMEDIAGIDVFARIRQFAVENGLASATAPGTTVPRWLYDLGRYGQKTGAGWYRYEPGSRTPLPDPLLEELAARAAVARGVRRRSISSEEILWRLMVAQANEGANILDEGIATRPGDIDVIYAHGFGFPRHQGGPMAWADEIGLPWILQKVEEYRDRLGAHWRPAPLLERLVAEGMNFYHGVPPQADN
jgi:3-hydroxyacyl-CoA dehydrogenase